MSEMPRYLKKTLSEIIKNSSKVFVVGHNAPDFDSIASALAVASICRLFGRKAYVVVAENDQNLEPGVRKIVEENREKHNIIDLETFEKLMDKNSSLVITDTNKENLLSVKDFLDDFKYKLIIDHHAEDEHTVDTEFKFIDLRASSASEIVTRLFQSYLVGCDSDIASFLLAGIKLDTNHYQNKKTSPKAYEASRWLVSKGASLDQVAELFRTEFETDCRINNLMFNGSLFETYERCIFQTRRVSFTVNRTVPSTIYKREDLAKVADRMLGYNVDASFALGYVDEHTISISARSKSDINVGEIMSQFGGGGNGLSAATRIDISSLEDSEDLDLAKKITSLEERLKKTVEDNIEESSILPPHQLTIEQVGIVTSLPERPPIKIKA